jgi:hypothetical protein
MATSEPDGGSDVAPLHPSNSSAPSSHPCSLRKSVPPTKEEALRLASGSIGSLTKARSQLITKGYLAQNGEISFLSPSLIFFLVNVMGKGIPVGFAASLAMGMGTGSHIWTCRKPIPVAMGHGSFHHNRIGQLPTDRPLPPPSPANGFRA